MSHQKKLFLRSPKKAVPHDWGREMTRCIIATLEEKPMTVRQVHKALGTWSLSEVTYKAAELLDVGVLGEMP